VRNAQKRDRWLVAGGAKTAKTIVKQAFSRHPPPATRHSGNVQKKVKKNVDASLAFWQITLTHGNNRTTTQHKMRTKTLLLSAAALLAAGITSSQAQVYSQNIVGYASIPTPQAGKNYLITIPFAVGVSNGANEIWPVVGGVPTLPDFSQILVWNGTGYTTYQADSASPLGWDDNGGNPLTFAPKLPVGQGFFLNPFTAHVTNTFAGTVAVNVGTSNQMVLQSGGKNYLVGCPVPYAGAVTNGDSTTKAGGPGLSSLNGLPDFSQLLIWTGSGYTTYQSDSGSPSLWDDNGGNPIPQPPSISVGQGFFLMPFTGPYTWTVGL
jgi:hypothetical protein